MKDAPFVDKLLGHFKLSTDFERKQFVDALKAIKRKFGDDKRQGVLVFPFYPNRSLQDLADKAGKPDFSLIKRWLSQIVITLQNVHARGLIHRDIKPCNILFSENMDAYLSGFNMAKRYKKATHNRHLIGCFFNLAPEVLRGLGHSRASDVFALGFSFYNLVTPSYRKFKETVHKRVYELARLGRFEELACLVSKHKDLPVVGETPEELHDLYMRMVEPDPAKRISLNQIREHPFFKDVDWANIVDLKNE